MLEKKHAAIFENFLKLGKRLKIQDLTLDEVPAVQEVLAFVYHCMNYCKSLDAKPTQVAKIQEPKAKKKGK